MNERLCLCFIDCHCEIHQFQIIQTSLPEEKNHGISKYYDFGFKCQALTSSRLRVSTQYNRQTATTLLAALSAGTKT